MKVHFIRHAQINTEKSKGYVGITTEPVDKEEYNRLFAFTAPRVDMVYVSPSEACIETANILFPLNAIEVVDNLTKSIEDTLYKVTRRRIIECFDIIMWDAIFKSYEEIVFIAHDETFMTILDEHSFPHRDYEEWKLEYGESFSCEVNAIFWQSNKCLCDIYKN